jgi:hypothetical protein
MDKRIAKRHKRQVARAKAKVKVSEPDIRSEEQKKAARDASRPDTGRGGFTSRMASFARSIRNRLPAGKEAEPKAEE